MESYIFFFYRDAPQIQTRGAGGVWIDDRIEMQMRNGLGVKLWISYRKLSKIPVSPMSEFEVRFDKKKKHKPP